MVSTDKFNLLHSYIFRNNNVMTDNTFSYKDKSILYICQNGTSGYANAAKGYIYDYSSFATFLLTVSYQIECKLII